MPFKYIVDRGRNIVVLKTIGDVTAIEMISEMYKAVKTRRGENVSRRLVDMTDSNFNFKPEDAKKILKILKIHTQELGSKKIAVLLGKIPSIPEFQQIRLILKSTEADVEFFDDKAKVAQYFNRN